MEWTGTWFQEMAYCLGGGGRTMGPRIELLLVITSWYECIDWPFSSFRTGLGYLLLCLGQVDEFNEMERDKEKRRLIWVRWGAGYIRSVPSWEASHTTLRGIGLLNDGKVDRATNLILYGNPFSDIYRESRTYWECLNPLPLLLNFRACTPSWMIRGGLSISSRRRITTKAIVLSLKPGEKEEKRRSPKAVEGLQQCIEAEASLLQRRLELLAEFERTSKLNVTERKGLLFLFFLA